MSVYQDRKQALEENEFRMGLERGRLAVTLDLLTDALVLVGQHGVYCQSARQPGKPAMDIQIVSKCITDAKELVISVMTELKKPSETASKRIPRLLPPDRSSHSMPRHHYRVVRKRQQFIVNRPQDLPPVSTRQIRPPDTIPK
jgi:hypothetical protein